MLCVSLPSLTLLAAHALHAMLCSIPALIRLQHCRVYGALLSLRVLETTQALHVRGAELQHELVHVYLPAWQYTNGLLCLTGLVAALVAITFLRTSRQRRANSNQAQPIVSPDSQPCPDTIGATSAGAQFWWGGPLKHKEGASLVCNKQWGLLWRSASRSKQLPIHACCLSMQQAAAFQNNPSHDRAEWEIAYEELEIAKQPDGSDWLLGEGQSGKVYKALKNGIQARSQAGLPSWQ